VEEAIDPICGMTVAVAAAKETAVRDGVTYYFCSAHCRKRFEAETAHV
jgi:Cu+-exporting ATPase